MKFLNEHIARKTKEDKINGRVWGRCYKSQALLDEEPCSTVWRNLPEPSAHEGGCHPGRVRSHFYSTAFVSTEPET